VAFRNAKYARRASAQDAVLQLDAFVVRVLIGADRDCLLVASLSSKML
jgi:hypothetical protein